VIAGIGTDIVAIGRMRALWDRHAERGMVKILAPDERADCAKQNDPARFMAKRFAAKEALGKALGCGIRAPLLLPEIAITHDVAGKPSFRLSPDADELLSGKGLCAHLSLSDEQDYVVAFVVVETQS
jgi:holo-[acyl-carrier protein] synthase